MYDDAKRDFHAIFSAVENAARMCAKALSGREPHALNTAPTKGNRLVKTDIPTDVPGQVLRGWRQGFRGGRGNDGRRGSRGVSRAR